MRRAINIRKGARPGDGDHPSVTLTFDDRFRRRIKLTDDWGDDFLLDLAEATRMEEGDVLILDDGGVVSVRAAPEPVIDIQCSSASHAAQLAWHLGNRHTPLQILDNGGMRIRRDHVLREMARGLGAAVVDRSAPFSPESGAYADAGGGGHSHDHHHDHNDDLAETRSDGRS